MHLSTNASVLLTAALKTNQNQIINKSDNLAARKIIIGEKTFGVESQKEYGLWLSALEELHKNGMIQTTTNPIIYSVTPKGHDWQGN